MTNKTTMLEPVGYVSAVQIAMFKQKCLESNVEIHISQIPFANRPPSRLPAMALITTDQAEAYAEARVKEALECVSREVHNVLHPTNPREDWTQYAYIRKEAAHDAESAIRALIPPA